MKKENSARVELRFPRSLKKRLDECAEREGISLNEWLKQCIEKHVSAEQKQ